MWFENIFVILHFEKNKSWHVIIQQKSKKRRWLASLLQSMVLRRNARYSAKRSFRVEFP